MPVSNIPQVSRGPRVVCTPVGLPPFLVATRGLQLPFWNHSSGTLTHKVGVFFFPLPLVDRDPDFSASTSHPIPPLLPRSLPPMHSFARGVKHYSFSATMVLIPSLFSFQSADPPDIDGRRLSTAVGFSLKGTCGHSFLYHCPPSSCSFFFSTPVISGRSGPFGARPPGIKQSDYFSFTARISFFLFSLKNDPPTPSKSGNKLRSLIAFLFADLRRQAFFFC